MPRDTREAILTAALEVFSERGFHAATVPQVARRAGIGAGTIYGHFSSKEELGNALYQRWKLRYVEHVLSSIPREGPWRARFRGFWQGMVRFAQEHPNVLEYLEFHHHSTYLDSGSHEATARLATEMSALIEAGQADEVFVDGPPLILTNMIYGAFLRLLRVGRSGWLELTPELFAAAEERAWAMIRR
ncbi:MAG: TetR/AcrR family transcriptional regulator [Myxococcota bacterium]